MSSDITTTIPPSQPVSAPQPVHNVTAVTRTTEVLGATTLQKFGEETLKRAEAALAQHVGAVARIIVRRAAGKARDETELYLLLADEIEDKNEKRNFIRKAISVSGRS